MSDDQIISRASEYGPPMSFALLEGSDVPETIDNTSESPLPIIPAVEDVRVEPFDHPRSWSPPPLSLHADSVADDNEEPPRLSEYMERRRNLLEVIKELHSTGIQNDLDLPQIVVVGSQSVGKSSLIESMSGLCLPRDTGTCTRCPMECRLQNAGSWSCKIVLRFQYDAGGRALADIREIEFGETLYNKGDVERMLRRAQRAILRPGVPPEKFLDDSDLDVEGYEPLTFSPNCVCIRVAGPNVPDLYFYDLPGIIANVGDGGKEEDIKLVQNLAKGYIQKPNCIVLLVISCETDFENQGAGRLVLKDPSLRQRTIGVLTKIDRIEPGATSKWVRMLKNQENHLLNGWFCVKQPDPLQLEAGISWEDAKSSEKEFFDTVSPWKALDARHRSRLGSEGLAERLAANLSELASRELPRIRAKVEQYMLEVAAELERLAPPQIANPRKEIITLLRDFNKALAKHIEGLPPDVTTTDYSDTTQTGLIHNFHQAYERFRRHVHRTAPQFRPWSSKQKVADDLSQAMLSHAKEDDDAVGLGAVNQLYLDEVLDLARRSRTRELPGNCPFTVKELLINQSVKRWSALAQDCFDEIEHILTSHVDRLVDTHFLKYEHGGLRDTVMMVARAHIRESARDMAEKLEGLCRSEASPYTQNEHYFFDYKARFLRRYRLMYKQSMGSSQGLVASLQNHDSADHVGIPGRESVMSNTSDRDEFYHRGRAINAALSALSSIGIEGICAADFINLLPSDDMGPALDIMAEVRAYFQVAYKRFGDNVPNQIDADFVRKIDDGLDMALRSLDLSTEQCLEWLKEPAEVVKKREDLRSKKRRLASARDKLASFCDED